MLVELLTMVVKFYILYTEVIIEVKNVRSARAKNGVIPGAITGFIFGLVAISNFVVSAYIGFVIGFMETIPDYLTDIGFIINQYGAHTMLNMFLMACYGAFYVRFYDAIPSKALIKGAIFGLTIYVLTNLYHSAYSLAYGNLPLALWAGFAVPDVYIAVGILIEGFYNKRRRAFPIAAAILLFSILKYFFISSWLLPN
jgi:hypothetical protein